MGSGQAAVARVQKVEDERGDARLDHVADALRFRHGLDAGFLFLREADEIHAEGDTASRRVPRALHGISD